MTATSLRVLLEGLIDYAGLFPPAALSMQDAVQNYARYREGEHAWALGRFVVPEDRAHEVPEEFPLTVLWSGGLQAADDSAGLKPGSPLETKAASIDDITRIASVANGRTIYVELTDLALIPHLAQHGLRAKIRTGGITADAFPAIENIAAFLRACKQHDVPFKATAGLHHPLRCIRPLTYDADAPTGTMHGFLNVFLAAALLDHAQDVLREDDSHAFTFDDEGVAWRGQRVSTNDLASMRQNFATSFGSCSFEEPIGDLRALQLLA
jgi:hypothetical protein